jgi:hypothetical protein
MMAGSGNHHSERAMLRWTIPLVLAIAAVGTAAGPDEAFARRGVYRAAARLPAGLPRPHYNFRTTVSWAAPSSYRQAYVPPVYAYQTPDLLFTPYYVGISPYLAAAYSYDYPAAYYGVPYAGYWVPYACAVNGYC